MGIAVEPQEVRDLHGVRPFAPTSEITLVLAGDAEAQALLRVGADQLSEWCRGQNIAVHLVQAGEWDGQGDSIVIATRNALPDRVSTDAVWRAVTDGLEAPGSEGYILVAKAGLVVAAGTDTRGAFYGVQTILQLLEAKSIVPAVVIRDWPDFPLRAAMMFYKPEPEERFKELAAYRYNAVLFETTDWYRLDQQAHRANVERWMMLCRKYGMEPIPHVQTHGHAWELLKVAPECAEGMTAVERIHLNDDRWRPLECRNVLDLPNCPITVKDVESGKQYQRGIDFEVKPGELAYKYAVTNAPWEIRRLGSGSIGANQRVQIRYGYVPPNAESSCISDPKTRQIIEQVLRQTMELVKPRYIHVGHDEVRLIGQDPRSRARGLSNAELLADGINFHRDLIERIDPECRMMIWPDTMDLHQHASGLDTLEAINLVPKDIILCHWWYLDGWEEWMRANMEHTTRRGLLSMGTAWYQRQNAADWVKVVRENEKWNGTAQGVIFAPWPDPKAPIWQNLQLVGQASWSARVPLPQEGDPIRFNPSQLPLDATQPSGVTRHQPMNETFDALDDRDLPRSWHLDYTPNGTTSRRAFGEGGKSFEVSGDRLEGRGTRLWFDDTYCYGAIHVGQKVWLDSATAGDGHICKTIEAYGPGFEPRAFLKIVGKHGALQRFMVTDTVSGKGESVAIPNASISSDRWVDVDLAIDLDAMTWGVWIDGKEAFKGAPLAVQQRSLAGAKWGARTDGKIYNGFWIDNVQISHFESIDALMQEISRVK